MSSNVASRKNAPEIERATFIGERPMSIVVPLSFMLGLFVAIWIVTEYLAVRLRFNPSLGFHIGWIYPPWDAATWTFQFFQPLQHIFGRGYTVYPAEVYAAFDLLPYVGGVAFLVGIAIASIVAVQSQKGAANAEDLYDSGSKWATEAVAKKDKLLGGKAGPIIGGFDVGMGGTKHLRYSGELGLSYTEPPGGGKSSFLKSNFLIPLQHSDAGKWDDKKRRMDPWGEEPVIIASDPKFELYRETSGYQHLALGKRVGLLAPLGVGRNINIAPEELECYNPFWSIRLGTERGFQDCYFRTLAIVDGEGEGLKTHWDRTSLSWGAAALEKLGFRALNLGDPEIFSLPGLLEFVSAFGSLDKLLDFMLKEPDDPAGIFGWTETDPHGRQRETRVKPSIAQAVREMMNKDPKERAGVYSTFITFLAPYRSEVLRRYITRSTFSWSEMANNQERSSTIYLGMDPMDIPKMRSYLRLVVGDAVEELTSGGTLDLGGRSARGNYRPVVFAMDEMAAWRKLQEVEHGSGYFRGYGVYLWLIWQSVAQQRRYYGKENLIDETMDVLIYGRPKTTDGAETIEEMLGVRTELVHKRSMAGARFAIVAPQAQDTIDAMKLPMLSTKEIMQIPKDRYLLFFNGHNYYARKWEYFKNKTLRNRARIPYVRKADRDGVKEPLFIRSIESMLTDEQMEKWTSFTQARKRSQEVAHRDAAGDAIDEMIDRQASPSVDRAAGLETPAQPVVEPAEAPPKEQSREVTAREPVVVKAQSATEAYRLSAEIIRAARAARQAKVEETQEAARAL